MSRIGNKPIPVPSNVEVNIKGSEVSVKGPKGNLDREFHKDMTIAYKDGKLIVTRPTDEPQHRALHGLTRSLLANMVTGVSEGYSRTLELVGVGYRAAQNGTGVTLNVMKSHTVEISPLEGVTIEVEGNNKVHVRGIDKQAVGQVAAVIRKSRPPNVYTGKGVRYEGEIVHIKPGKSARRV